MNVVKARISLIFILLTLGFGGRTQESKDFTGNWLMATGTNRIHDRWSVHTEFQYRYFRPISDAEQLFARAGLNYHLTRDVMFTAGYAYAGNYTFGEDNDSLISQENRVWQQINLRHDLNRVIIESRFRVEQRWVGEQYLDRIRHRVWISYKLNGHKKLVRRTWSAILSNEIFIHATRNPLFDRNRLYLALGCHIVPEVQIQVGYLRQAVPSFSKNHLQFGIFWNLDLRRKTQEIGLKK